MDKKLLNYIAAIMLLLFTAPTFLSAQEECDCDFELDIVCVSVDDGEIIPYPNLCWAECDGYTADDLVDCGDVIDPNECDCDFELDIVCVEDEFGYILSFPNACFAECEGYSSDDFVDCEVDDDPWIDDCACDFEFEPVCVLSDEGDTIPYPNLCWAECDGYTADQVVECGSLIDCTPDCDCPFDFEPVCVVDSTGNLIAEFINSCWAECEGFTADQFEDCGDSYEDPFDPDCDCEIDTVLVCVVDEFGEVITLPGECWVECLGYSTEDIVECEEYDDPWISDCDCEFDLEFVCVEDSTGFVQTYPNACWAECDGYTADDFVDCNEDPFVDDCDCDYELDFVCVEDSAGFILTFPNPCWAECEGFTADDFVDCEIDDDPWVDDCDCDFDLEFVCVEDENGEIQVFPNACWAECEGFTPDDFVDCEIDDPFGNDCDCDYEEDYVCVEDEFGYIYTYTNACWAACDGYTADDFVDCEIDDPFDDCGCDLELDLVCAEGEFGELLIFLNECWAECLGYDSEDLSDCDFDDFDRPTNGTFFRYAVQSNSTISMEIAPNPARQLSNITLESKLSGQGSITVSNALGQIITHEEVQVVEGLNKFELLLRDWNTGVYTVTMEVQQQQITKRLVVQK